MKTVSLELSKQLKEAGYPQVDCAFYYDVYHLGKEDQQIDFLLEKQKENEHFTSLASPSADEILEQLPESFNGWHMHISRYDEWGIVYELWQGDALRDTMEQTDKSLADAAAKCWLYLKEHNLLPQEKKERKV